MPTQLGPGEDIRGAPVSPSNPEHFPNRNQEPNGARTRLSQGGCTSGLAQKWVGTCETVGSPVSAAGGGAPALAASLAERSVRPAGTGAVRRRRRGEAGRGRGGRSRPRRRKQPPPQLKECGRGLPAGAGEGESFEHFHPARSRRLGPARPRPGHRLFPSRREGRKGGGGTCTSAFKRRSHALRPHLPFPRQQGAGYGRRCRGGRGARRALVRRRSGRTTDLVFPKWRQRWMWIPRAAPTAARARSALK